ncbi:MAG: hypothetical protein KKA81_08870 [Bacteroidetes bacterium]|nr:hypothetical protein [Bacteroidota bacterium]
MKTIRVLLSIVLVAVLTGTFAQQETKVVTQQDGQEIKAAVYYFHLERRCMTCKNVEAQSKKALEQLYPGEMEKGTVVFKSVNIEDKSGDELKEKYGIKGQTLLVVKGDKKKDLTSEGFLYAKSDPDKLKAEIEKAIKEL